MTFQVKVETIIRDITLFTFPEARTKEEALMFARGKLKIMGETDNPDFFRKVLKGNTFRDEEEITYEIKDIIETDLG